MRSHGKSPSMSKSTALRELIESDKLVVKPSVHDALTARIAEEAGFEMIGMSGYGTSLSAIGLPDAGYLTMSEMVRQAQNIAATVDIPVLADGDTGFGNALNVRRTTREFIQHTDVGGFFMEDQVAPKRCGHVAGKQIISREEAVGKLNAASDVRDDLDEDFVIMARCDAIGAVSGSLDEAIERGNLYAEAGADIIFIEGPTSEKQLQRIGAEVDAPLYFNQTGVSPYVDFDTLEEWGFDMSGCPMTMRPTITHVYDHLVNVRENGIEYLAEFREENAEHPMGNLHEFSGFEEIRDLEEKYLPEEENLKYDHSIGYNPADSS